jgi:hypothetical protein
MDLGGWLRSLGLEQYEATFRANAIEADVPHDLTGQDLEKLGVLLGHRRRLLRAIAELNGRPAARISASPCGGHSAYTSYRTAAESPAQSKPPANADMSQLMFTPSVRSTSSRAKNL